MAEWLRVLATLLEDRSSVLSTILGGSKLPTILTPGIQHPHLASIGTYRTVAFTHKNTISLFFFFSK